jgi:hypothetical protein
LLAPAASVHQLRNACAAHRMAMVRVPVVSFIAALLGFVLAAVAALAVQGDEDPSPPIPGLGLFR